MRVLLIEDSERLQRSIAAGLRKEGFKVDATGDGNEGLWFGESFDYDVVILDLMLPGLDGLSILRQLRRKQRPASVLILSAKDTVEDRVEGLQTGADDYLVKPFAFEELLARIRSLIRRRYHVKQDLISIGKLRINMATRTVSRGETVIQLPPREYALLEFLALRRGTVVGRMEIEEHIYDERRPPLSNVVDSAIASLRKKLGQAGEPSLIKTQRKAGYIIE
jgi:DNA-binding response OmpR family regulator